MNRLRKSLSLFWYLYVLVPLLGVALVCYFSYLVNKPRGIETISIFVGSLSTSSTSLREKLEDNKPSYLREIVIRSYNYTDSSFDSYCSTFARCDADIIILPSSKLNDETIMYYYAPIDKEYFGFASCYYPGTSSFPYGGLIHSSLNGNNSLITYSDETHNEDYYIFFKKNSPHLEKEHDTCIYFASLIKDNVL